MKRTSLLIFLAAPAIVAQTTTLEEILVVVNNHIITRKAFQQNIEQQYAELYRQFSGQELDTRLEDARRKTLEKMVDDFVLIDVATGKEYIQHMAPTETEILENFKKQSQMSSDAELERAVKSELGVSLSEFLRNYREKYIIDILIGQEVYRKVPVEDQEARLYYNEHQSDFKTPARFRVRELIISKGATSEERESAKASLEKIKADLKNGASFESLVKDYSTSLSKGTGGDLGWTEKGLLLKPIEDAALTLKPDEISDAIETDKDYILIQLVASELEGFKPFEAVKEEIVYKLREPKADNALQHYLQSQRIRANIRYIVPKEQIIKG
jgi:parvulin-like peptidyl-prolyl isomerase